MLAALGRSSTNDRHSPGPERRLRTPQNTSAESTPEATPTAPTSETLAETEARLSAPQPNAPQPVAPEPAQAAEAAQAAQAAQATEATPTAAYQADAPQTAPAASAGWAAPPPPAASTQNASSPKRSRAVGLVAALAVGALVGGVSGAGVYALATGGGQNVQTTANTAVNPANITVNDRDNATIITKVAAQATPSVVTINVTGTRQREPDQASS